MNPSKAGGDVPGSTEELASYSPSGRAAWGGFLAMAVAAIAVSVAMGYALALVLCRVPTIIGETIFGTLPVLGAVVAAVHFGRCRNPRLAVMFAATCAAAFYLGA